MARQEHDVQGKGRTAQRDRPRGAPQRSASQGSERPAGRTGNAGGGKAPEASAAPGPGTAGPLPGLDEARHAAAQKAAQQADALREVLFAGLMADALGLNTLFDGHAIKVYLERLLEEAGRPHDPVERMMLEQLAVAHFRIAQLHVGAGQAKGAEAVKLYNAAAARLLGEFRRTA